MWAARNSVQRSSTLEARQKGGKRGVCAGRWVGKKKKKKQKNGLSLKGGTRCMFGSIKKRRAQSKGLPEEWKNIDAHQKGKRKGKKKN